MIRFTQKGDFSKSTKYLNRIRHLDRMQAIRKYAQEGVDALASATPVDTGVTAASWYYKIVTNNDSITITYNNSNIQNGVPIAIILQYGHGTRNGGWVEGRDYINPAIQPIFDKIAAALWREVTKV